MNALDLAQEIINGRRITREDDLSFFLSCELKNLCEGADRIRAHFIGDKVDLCSIINGRSGRCPEDCKYCAQSAHNHTNCEIYDFLPKEKIVEACKLNESEGVDRFSIVTAGRALLTNDGEIAFQSGASASITGNMLTTAACATIRSDREMLKKLNRDVTPEYWRNK